MKISNLISSFYLLFFVNVCSAQLPNGSVIQNFEVTDLNGNQYNLYEILDDGQSVLIDFFATWCNPCWDYLQSGQLDEIYRQLGPEGTNELIVLSIEGEQSTSIDDVFGEGNNTLGDYTFMVESPIVNNDNIPFLFNLVSWPSYYFICPDRSVTLLNKIGFGTPNLDNIIPLLNNCRSPELELNVELIEYLGIEDNPYCEEALLSWRFQNVSEQAINKIGYHIFNSNDTLINESIHVDLNSWDIDTIVVTNIPIPILDPIRFEIISLNDQEIEPIRDILIFEEKTIRFSTASLKLSIQMDDFPEDISFKLQTVNEEVLFERDSFFIQDELVSFTIPLESSGCFEFLISDGFGNGLCCEDGNGFYSLMTNNDEIIVHGAEFGFVDKTRFSINSLTSINEISSDSFKVSPNPSNQMISFSLNDNISPISITILNTIGDQVYHSDYIDRVDISNFNQGLYIIEVDFDEKKLHQLLVKTN